MEERMPVPLGILFAPASFFLLAAVKTDKVCRMEIWGNMGMAARDHLQYFLPQSAKGKGKPGTEGEKKV